MTAEDMQLLDRALRNVAVLRRMSRAEACAWLARYLDRHGRRSRGGKACMAEHRRAARYVRGLARRDRKARRDWRALKLHQMGMIQAALCGVGVAGLIYYMARAS